jgi:serine/threonine protein kinase
MFNYSPLFPGDTDIDQLLKIISGKGTPTTETWPNINKLPDYHKIKLPDIEAKPLSSLLSTAPRQALDLIESMLAYSGRISAEDALRHDFFFTDPLPEPLPSGRTITANRDYTSLIP